MGLLRNQIKDRVSVESKKFKAPPSRTIKKRKFDGEDQAAFPFMKKPLREPQPPKQGGKSASAVEIKCYDATRTMIRERLVEAFSKVAGEVEDMEKKEQVSACDPVGVAVSVESVLYKNMGPSKGAKAAVRYRAISFNVKDPKNPDFRRKLLLGEVKPETMVTMLPEEMDSDERQSQNKQIIEHALAKIPDHSAVDEKESECDAQ
ncbi:transcription elongation factor TFIIS [Citrus sinensis]|uniref:Transcription elongation factor TFIIS n=1 Tax=Citrus sinensis TaxID=2711 RepID=A0ACB8JXZ9_CITSI|nr:transcription elongation factor TFIIS [Citrus sinensis]